MVHILKVAMSKTEKGSWNFISVSHTGGKDPSTWAIMCYVHSEPDQRQHWQDLIQCSNKDNGVTVRLSVVCCAITPIHSSRVLTIKNWSLFFLFAFLFQLHSSVMVYLFSDLKVRTTEKDMKQKEMDILLIYCPKPVNSLACVWLNPESQTTLACDLSFPHPHPWDGKTCIISGPLQQSPARVPKPTAHGRQ